MVNHSNRNVHAREVNLLKKRGWSQNSDDEDKDSFYGTHMTEERYRSMLGDHVQKYKRRSKDASSSLAQNRVAVPLVRSNNGLKARKLGSEHRGGLHAGGTTSEWQYDSNSQKQGNPRDTDFVHQYGTDRFAFMFYFLYSVVK